MAQKQKIKMAKKQKINKNKNKMISKVKIVRNQVNSDLIKSELNINFIHNKIIF